MRQGSKGDHVARLQELLRTAGFDPGPIDGDFGPRTEAAVRAFQSARGLVADGIAGTETMSTLMEPGTGGRAPVPDRDPGSITDRVDAALIAPMFPGAPPANIETHLPHVLRGLDAFGLGDRDMVLMALATIRAETGRFAPVDEGMSKYNTTFRPGTRTPALHPFDRYDHRRSLGNTGPPDGARFKGRGFVQLTGRANYATVGAMLGMDTDLMDRPELANDPALAGRILAAFLSRRAARIRTAIAIEDLAHARRLVNGGRHGLEAFEQAFETGAALLPER